MSQRINFTIASVTFNMSQFGGTIFLAAVILLWYPINSSPFAQPAYALGVRCIRHGLWRKYEEIIASGDVAGWASPCGVFHMFKIIEPYVLTFIAIFVAVDAIGNIPLFVSLVEGMNKSQRHRVIVQSVSTATLVSIIFMFLGKLVLRFIGITIADFQIAGGALLFVLATGLLLPGSYKTFTTSNHDREIGVFPLGTPLITGPAVLTTTLMMLDSYGVMPTFAALILNMLIIWFTLCKSNLIIKVLGSAGSRAFAKIMYILLAAIGVMMVRKGVLGVFVQ